MMESVNGDKLADLLANVQSILNAASVKCHVVDESFPAKFFEKNPDKIYESYCKFIKNRSNAEGSIRNEDKLALTTINKRFENGEYEPVQGGFYKLYHDVKLVCTILIHFYPQGTRNYQLVDKFYKFSSELLLRECYRIGIALTQANIVKSRSGKSLNGNEVDEYDDDDDATELDKIISYDFIKISMNYSVPISQTYQIRTKDMDLFSSIISKSNLDKRPHELPNTNFKINNILPQTDIENEAPRLGFVGANTSNIPDPTLPPTEMMTRFLHPNWYALPTTVWLKYGNYNSWAPSFNENGTVVDSTTRGLIWLERIGYMNLYEKNEKKEKQEEILDSNEGNKNSEQKDKNEIIDGKSNGVNNNSDDNDTGITSENAEGFEDTEQSIIKLHNLYNWAPSNYIGDDEIESFQNGTPDKLVTESLAKLKKLRKERILNRVSKPTTEEREIYFKVKRILKEVILAKKVSKLPINNVRAFPVLQTNYSGSIPVVRAQPGRKRKHKK
ncbi:hypothetical protein SMKI_12G1080 [Saccharomyces mikatae IFO 1815]|uniref:Bromo domain-containing protein n=1 Tax=Saccharomyces mikatae IFO 1815 TaxID=226126 RepID=A0AA35IR88_SACMI|nr:uncharacterized protein SMKI_12G1080 [Saccharomyces mikatae IFO 1815]CAI4034971.1 hypothetical protein SMKI_12G1080 [Saccharomyces mikatae IFO 1815]